MTDLKNQYIARGLRFAALLLFVITMIPTHVFAQTASEYILGVGDKLRITVFGEADLSGNFEVSSTGKVSMPLISEIDAQGRTVAQLQSDITSKLGGGGYLRDPKVSVEVLTYRPFFILGEVMKPGSYTYVNGMTVITAVAMAGGYTYRADKEEIMLKRGEGGAEERVKEDAIVMPGDTLRIPERFF